MCGEYSCGSLVGTPSSGAISVGLSKWCGILGGIVLLHWARGGAVVNGTSPLQAGPPTEGRGALLG